MSNQQEIEDYIQQWSAETIRITGAVMAKKGMVFSDKTKQNLTIEHESFAGAVQVRIIARDGIRFSDQAAGRGWHKGKIDEGTISKTAREKKPVWNRPVYSRLAKLREVLTIKVTENTFDTLKQSISDGK